MPRGGRAVAVRRGFWGRSRRSRRGWLNLCEGTFVWRFVVAETLEYGGAQLGSAARACTVGPLGIFDFSDEFGLDPTDFAQGLDFSVERILFGFEALQGLPYGGERFLIESAASLADVNQAAFVVVESEDERSEMGASTLGCRVASDDAFDLVADFDLQPLAAAAFFVATVAAL